MDVTIVTLSTYDGESSYASSLLSQIRQHLKETCDLILGYLDHCLSITSSISDVTSLYAMM